MKKTIFVIFCAALAASCPVNAERVYVEVLVRDSDTTPVEGATAILVLPRYGKGRTNETVRSLTNGDGVASLLGNAEQDYMVRVEKEGYYYTVSPRLGISSSGGSGSGGSLRKKFELELRPIRNPVEGVVRAIERVKIPNSQESSGFDLLVGDWVSPFGKGIVSDIVVKITGQFVDRFNYDQTFSIEFPNKDDGIMVYQIETEHGSAQAFPYEAPISGYSRVREWRTRRALAGSRGTTSAGTTVDLSGRTNYIFRIRTELDDMGRVSGGLYGLILGDIRFVAGDVSIGRSISFDYVVNPTGSLSIEFDPEKRGHLAY